MWREAARALSHRLQQIVVVPKRREPNERKGSSGRKGGFEWEEGRQKFLHLGHSGQELVRFGLTPFAFVLRKGDKQHKIGRKPSSDGAKAKQTDRRSGRQAGVRQIE